MVPLVIQGDTLVEKYRSYNKLVNETKQEEVAEINYVESDLDNFFKIDIACKNRDVDYLLKVFQSEDMLYVSRAIKKSTWLITDPQYSHIVNRNYLYEQLYQYMIPKAFNKLLLHVRLNLKDEIRSEEFFNYHKDRDFKVALKWLPLCSVKFTENIIENHAKDIPDHLLKRLCEKSVTYLEIYSRIRSSHLKNNVFSSTSYLLKNNMEKYLDIIEACESFTMPRLGRRTTKLLMKKYPERVINKLEMYRISVNKQTFAKFIKPEDIKNFIIMNNKSHLTGFWFSHVMIKPFIDRLPLDSRFELIKEIFIDAKKKDKYDDIVFHPCRVSSRICTSKNIYCWYKYAQFNTAFEALKKLIRSESDPKERLAMFNILLKCAGDNMQNIYAVLKYYRQNHINEPTHCKVKFVYFVLHHTDTHKFDKMTWKYLKSINDSLNGASEQVFHAYIMSTILYNVVHNENVTDYLEQKFDFDTFKTYKKKLTGEEKEKLFLYLYKYLTSRIDRCNVDKETECIETIDLLKKALYLLLDWNKELEDFPMILDKIKEVVKIKQKNKWNIDLTGLYVGKKSWKKILFSNSIILSPTQETCINALKFGPKLLEEYKNEVEAICLDDYNPINGFLKMLRIYWPKSLANTFRDLFINKLGEKKKHRIIITGLFTLLPRNEVLNFAEKYAPGKAKTGRNNTDFEISLRKHIAMNLHLVRPLPPPATALLYAKRDYLKDVKPSLNVIFDNISRVQLREHLLKLLDSPVSLQKHAISVAFAKLKHHEIKELFSIIWKSNKNTSIRTHMFKKIFDFLCKSKDDIAIAEIWDLLSLIIENLSSEENKMIYTKLSQIENIPMSVRPKLWMKSYELLKSMPPQANCGILLTNLKSSMLTMMEFLENDFVAEIFFESFDEKFSTGKYEYQYLVAVFLLSTKTEEAHITRYNKILIPILDKSFEMWNKIHDGVNYVKYNLLSIFKFIDKNFVEIVLDNKMFLPISMFTDTLVRLRTNLDAEKNYVLLTTRKLALDCVKTFHEVLKTDEELKSNKVLSEDEYHQRWKPLFDKSAPKLGQVCVKYLKEDIDAYFPSIYTLFSQAFGDIFDLYFYTTWYKVKALKVFLNYKDFIYGHLFLLKSIPLYHHGDEEKNFKTEILKELSTHPSKEIRMHYNLWQNNLSFMSLDN